MRLGAARFEQGVSPIAREYVSADAESCRRSSGRRCAKSSARRLRRTCTRRYRSLRQSRLAAEICRILHRTVSVQAFALHVLFWLGPHSTVRPSDIDCKARAKSASDTGVSITAIGCCLIFRRCRACACVSPFLRAPLACPRLSRGVSNEQRCDVFRRATNHGAVVSDDNRPLQEDGVRGQCFV